MDYGKVLAATGTSGLLLGGIVISQAWLFGIVILVVAASALAIRLAWRHGKEINKI